MLKCNSFFKIILYNLDESQSNDTVNNKQKEIVYLFQILGQVESKTTISDLKLIQIEFITYLNIHRYNRTGTTLSLTKNQYYH